MSMLGTQTLGLPNVQYDAHPLGRVPAAAQLNLIRWRVGEASLLTDEFMPELDSSRHRLL